LLYFPNNTKPYPLLIRKKRSEGVEEMKDQEFMDIELGDNESLASLLQTIVTQKREELGTQSVYVKEVVSTNQNDFTIILEVSHSPF
jgi:hypothetical protein